MERLITLKVTLSDEELAEIVPSSSVWVEMHNNSSGGFVLAVAEIVNVKDIKPN